MNFILPCGDQHGTRVRIEHSNTILNIAEIRIHGYLAIRITAATASSTYQGNENVYGIHRSFDSDTTTFCHTYSGDQEFLQYDFEYSGVAEVRIVNRAHGGAQNFIIENMINGAEVRITQLSVCCKS